MMMTMTTTSEEEIKRKVSSYDATQFDQMRDYVRALYPGTVLDSKEGVKRIRFLCPCEGEPRFKVPTQQKRSSKKCGCNYMIYVILKNNRYLVKKCNLQHNDHDLETEVCTVLKAPKIRRFHHKINKEISDTSSESSSNSPFITTSTNNNNNIIMNNSNGIGSGFQVSASAFRPFIPSSADVRNQSPSLDIIAVMSLMELSNPNRLKLNLDMDSLNTSLDSNSTTFSSIQDSGTLTPASSVAESFEFSQRDMTPTFEGSIPSDEENAFKRKFELIC